MSIINNDVAMSIIDQVDDLDTIASLCKSSAVFRTVCKRYQKQICRRLFAKRGYPVPPNPCRVFPLLRFLDSIDFNPRTPHPMVAEALLGRFDTEMMKLVIGYCLFILRQKVWTEDDILDIQIAMLGNIRKTIAAGIYVDLSYKPPLEDLEGNVEHIDILISEYELPFAVQGGNFGNVSQIIDQYKDHDFTAEFVQHGVETVLSSYERALELAIDKPDSPILSYMLKYIVFRNTMPFGNDASVVWGQWAYNLLQQHHLLTRFQNSLSPDILIFDATERDNLKVFKYIFRHKIVNSSEITIEFVERISRSFFICARHSNSKRIMAYLKGLRLQIFDMSVFATTNEILQRLSL
jgi:hypothetical protein